MHSRSVTLVGFSLRRAPEVATLTQPRSVAFDGVSLHVAVQIYVHGATGGAANDTLAPGGTAQGYLERFDGDARIWTYAPAGVNAIDLVEVDAGDGLTFVGRAMFTGQFDLMIGDLSRAGDPRSIERAGMPPSERPFALLANGDARAIVGHHDLFVPTNYVEAWEDPFVFRWNVNDGAARGTFVTASSPEPDIATGAALGADGTVLIAGASRSGGGSWVRPVTSTIEAPWWGMPGGLDTVRTIHRLPDGDFVLAGSTSHPLGRAIGGQDAFVGRFSADLAIVRWITQFGSTAADNVVDLAFDDTGRTWVLGETDGDVAAAPAGDYDLFVVALDSDGTERWRWQRGSAGDERPSRIVVDACEHVLVSGASNGAIVPGGTTQGYDAFLLAVGPAGQEDHALRI